ncbi:MAG: hypothetical protein K9L22_10650 [Methylococcaceae bacterium]|nr:hypothetical protein [Methylococcaceae bacterium]
MTEEERRAAAMKIINRIADSAATNTAIFSQVPGMGVATLTTLYLEMVEKMATLFNQPLDSKAGRMLIMDACKHYATPLFKKSVVGWIPLIGNFINAKITYDLTINIGWFFYDYFAKNCIESTAL